MFWKRSYWFPQHFEAGCRYPVMFLAEIHFAFSDSTATPQEFTDHYRGPEQHLRWNQSIKLNRPRWLPFLPSLGQKFVDDRWNCIADQVIFDLCHNGGITCTVHNKPEHWELNSVEQLKHDLSAKILGEQWDLPFFPEELNLPPSLRDCLYSQDFYVSRWSSLVQEVNAWGHENSHARRDLNFLHRAHQATLIWKLRLSDDWKKTASPELQQAFAKISKYTDV